MCSIPILLTQVAVSEIAMARRYEECGGREEDGVGAGAKARLERGGMGEGGFLFRREGVKFGCQHI